MTNEEIESALSDAKALRDAILDVLDCGNAEKNSWRFNVDPLTSEAEDRENAQRLDFADAVVARVRAIKEFDREQPHGLNSETEATLGGESVR